MYFKLKYFFLKIISTSYEVFRTIRRVTHNNQLHFHFPATTMIPPTRKSRGNTQPTFADEQAKAAAVNELGKAVARAKPVDQCDPNPTIAENDDAAFFASLLRGETSFAPLDELNRPENPGKLEHSANGKRVMNGMSNGHEKLKKMKNEKKRIEDKNGGKSLEDVVKEHHGNDIDLCVPSLAPAGVEIGCRESLRDGIRESKDSKVYLRGNSVNALGQQNGIDLSERQLQDINYFAIMRGTSAEYAGYVVGSMGTIVNPQGRTVDAAISKATKAMDNLGEHIQKIAKNWDTVIPGIARGQGMPGSGVPDFGLRLINKENEPFDLRTMMSEEDIMKLLEVIVGFQIREPSGWDNFIGHNWPEEAKKADNMRGEKARNAAWRRLRDTAKKSFNNKMGAMPFEFERYDENGVLPGSVGSHAMRRKEAGFRFKIKDPENQRFEL